VNLPKTVYVSWRTEGSGDAYLTAELTPEEAIEDDGPTMIGVYRLVETKKFAKRAMELKR